MERDLVLPIPIFTCRCHERFHMGPFDLQLGPFVLCFIQLNFQRKVGVMYCRAGQSSEEDMYNNESSGPAFEEFLDLLGERVRLKGWEKYRAQLDNKSELKTHPTPSSECGILAAQEMISQTHRCSV